jgi:CheY-like chemotaxis protein
MDRGQLEQVVINLVVNARDAMPRGGRIAIRTDNLELEAELGQRKAVAPGAYVRLELADTGSGMSADVQRRIFEPFFTTKQRGKGTGLGLSIVFGIVRQAGGAISVQSAEGQGTTVEILLPALRASGVLSLVPEIESVPLGKGKTVLLVEDDAAVRRVVARILRGSGFEVLEAEDGNEGLRVAAQREGEIHLLVSDVMMPGLLGPEMAERLCRERPGLPVIFISGYTGGALEGRAGELRGAFVRKPFTEQELMKEVERGLSTTREPARAEQGEARDLPRDRR